MTRTSVSIANLHDGVTLTAEQAELVARALEYAWIYNPSLRADEDLQLLAAVANILRGERRDGSEPEGQ